MPDKLEYLIEQGFFASVAFIFTSMLMLLGFKVKSDQTFKTQVYKKIDKNQRLLTEKLDDFKTHVSTNHPTHNEFNLLLDIVTRLDEYIRDNPK